jgi:hypothetical protein
MAIPYHLTLRQAAQARDDFAQIMDELNGRPPQPEPPPFSERCPKP